MSFEVVVSDSVSNFLNSLDGKSKNICKNNLGKLSSPYPGKGSGDKEKIVVDGEVVYRLHIGRTYTAFYIIDKENKVVRVRGLRLDSHEKRTVLKKEILIMIKSFIICCFRIIMILHLQNPILQAFY